MSGGDVNRDRWANALILHFAAATELGARLDSTPRWRWRKRRRLERNLDRECQRADLAVRFLGAGPDARPLRSIIDDALR